MITIVSIGIETEATKLIVFANSTFEAALRSRLKQIPTSYLGARPKLRTD